MVKETYVQLKWKEIEKTMPKHFKSKEALRKYEAYLHIHKIKHSHKHKTYIGSKLLKRSLKWVTTIL